ncbi:MAG: acetylxylan esterase [Chloroflexi bacterium]|nr:acetylxylan esterase [Chloroflexota bacterium]MCI0779650.1 acetylxylan esterase [Chloroflexota bacterium]MCI0785204.1 acetylxylan esterase [Chloroflexota bacterium]MCI0792163.1 acetylxylan esterase [Chloroflexota bacterium]MCI0797494.1 acetylxylan esterase [Chloroflexota bacterium]
MQPKDLTEFWRRTTEELALTDLKPSLEEVPEQSGREFRTYSVVMESFRGRRIRGWYSVPNDPGPGGRFPAVLAVPGYGGDKPIPTHLVSSGFSVLTLYPRGQGESRHEWELESGTKLIYCIDDKEEYYYRGAYMDCVRGLDFLCSRPEVDAARLGMWSRSQGGGLTLATAALDHRLRVAVAEEPFLCNYPVSVDITTSPYRELCDYTAQHPEQREAILETLSYFDCKSLAPLIECPTLMNIGLKDETCPSTTIMPVFEQIPGLKAIHVYPELTHSPCTDFNAHAMNWLRRYLGA